MTKPPTFITDHQTPYFGVIIPYFQHRAGLLYTCITSVLQQSISAPLHIVVVDDGSPIPARDEIQRLDRHAQQQITLIEQRNSGASRARNSALDHLPVQTTHIAMLDSDDRWHPDFLAAASAAFAQEADLFFCNTQRFNQNDTRFDWQKKQELHLDAAHHAALPSAYALYRYQTDFFDYLLQRSNIISSSALVYRRAVAPKLRFHPQLAYGEDRLFKLHLGKHARQVIFSAQVLCFEEEGVNTYHNASWGHDKSLRFAAHYITMTKFILRDIALSQPQHGHIIMRLQHYRDDFCATLLHQLRRHTALDMRTIIHTLWQDPKIMTNFFSYLIRVIRTRR